MRLVKVRSLAEAGVTWWLENVYDNLWFDRGLQGMQHTHQAGTTSYRLAGHVAN
jgi:hypothetical protein